MPGLSIIYAFAYPTFAEYKNDPLHILAFFAAHLVVLLIIVAFLIPRTLEVFVPAKRRNEGDRAYAPQVVLGTNDIRVSEGVEAGSSGDSGSDDMVATDKTFKHEK